MPRRPDSTDIQVGHSIRAHRLIARMSQNELANRLGISFQQLQKYEKGANRVGAGRLLHIAGILDVPVAALFEPETDPSRGKRTAGGAPVRFMSDRNALRLLTSYRDITDRAIRRTLIELVDGIAKATRRREETSS